MTTDPILKAALEAGLGAMYGDLIGFAAILTATKDARIAELEAVLVKLCDEIESPGICKQSKKNANAGFVDWRDWEYLLGLVAEARVEIQHLKNEGGK